MLYLQSELIVILQKDIWKHRFHSHWLLETKQNKACLNKHCDLPFGNGNTAETKSCVVTPWKRKSLGLCRKFVFYSQRKCGSFGSGREGTVVIEKTIALRMFLTSLHTQGVP